MSKQLEALKNSIREILSEIEKEEEDEIKTEISVTANVAGYDTPRAFSKDNKHDSEYVKRMAGLTGYSTIKESVNEAAMNPVKKVVNAILKKHNIQAMKTYASSVGGAHNMTRGGYRWEGDYFLGFYGKVSLADIEKVAADMKKAGVKVTSINGGAIGGDFSKTGLSEATLNEGKKRFKQQDGVGSSKYTISYHDGKKKHKDGSDFFDIKIFKNKPELEAFKKDLVSKGFVSESVNENRFQKLRLDQTMTPNQKIGVGVREIRRKIDEIEKFLEWYGKIKTEHSLKGENFWKRTNHHIYRIKERLSNIGKNVTTLRK